MIRPHWWANLGKEPDSAPFDYHSQSTLVRKMKSFGVYAEWIPGEERRGKSTALASEISGILDFR
jgi:hypothetical protein